MGKFVIKKSSNDQFYWLLKAGNGEIILQSEMYTTKQGSKKGIESSKKNVQDECFETKTSTKGDPYFVQKSSGNHEVLGKSEMYSSNAACQKGIDSVKRNAPDADVVDETTS